MSIDADLPASDITVPKVCILDFCSVTLWTAVLETVQRNPLTTAITLQSIPPFGRFPSSGFRCVHWDPLSNALNKRILQWILLTAQ